MMLCLKCKTSAAGEDGYCMGCDPPTGVLYRVRPATVEVFTKTGEGR